MSDSDQHIADSEVEVLQLARDIVRNLYAASTAVRPGAHGLASSKSKTGDPKCSAAVSAWVRKQATPETHKQLAKCRAAARAGGQAGKLREAGQEAKAQHLEHRVAQGEPLTVKERAAKAKELKAAHATQATPPPAVESQPAVEPHKVVEPKVETPRGSEWQDNPYFVQARRYRTMADAVHEDRRAARSGADRTDAVRHDLVAKAFGRLGQGEGLESVLGKLRGEWNEFVEQKKKQIEAASKIKRGPSSGSSVRHHEHADPGAIDSDEIFIRNIAGRVGSIGGKSEEKPVEPPKVTPTPPRIKSLDEMLGARSEAMHAEREQRRREQEAKQSEEKRRLDAANDQYLAQAEAAKRRGIKPSERTDRSEAARRIKKLPHAERAAKHQAIQEEMGSAASLHGKKQPSFADRLGAIRQRKTPVGPSPELTEAKKTVQAAGRGTPAPRPSAQQRIRAAAQWVSDRLEKERPQGMARSLEERNLENARRDALAQSQRMRLPERDREKAGNEILDMQKLRKFVKRYRDLKKQFEQSRMKASQETAAGSLQGQGGGDPFGGSSDPFGSSADPFGASPKVTQETSEPDWLKRAEDNLLESPTHPGEYQDRAGIAPSIYKGRANAIKAIAAAHQKDHERQRSVQRQQEAERQRAARRTRAKTMVGQMAAGGKMTPQTKFRAAGLQAQKEATKGFTKGTVKIKLGDRTTQDVQAMIKGELAVHPEFGGDSGRKASKKYKVTHIPTGLALGPAMVSANRAKEIAHAIHRRGLNLGEVKAGMSSQDPQARKSAERSLKFIKSLFTQG